MHKDMFDSLINALYALNNEFNEINNKYGCDKTCEKNKRYSEEEFKPEEYDESVIDVEYKEIN